jgi:hypothetical protein
MRAVKAQRGQRSRSCSHHRATQARRPPLLLLYDGDGGSGGGSLAQKPGWLGVPWHAGHSQQVWETGSHCVPTAQQFPPQANSAPERQHRPALQNCGNSWSGIASMRDCLAACRVACRHSPAPIPENSQRDVSERGREKRRLLRRHPHAPRRRRSRCCRTQRPCNTCGHAKGGGRRRASDTIASMIFGARVGTHSCKHSKGPTHPSIALGPPAPLEPMRPDGRTLANKPPGSSHRGRVKRRRAPTGR